LKNKSLIVLLTLVLLTIAAATGCSSSFVSNEQLMGLQNQVNSLSNSLNSTQQQLASTQQQLVSAQQSLSQAQSQLQQQKTYVPSAQPANQPNIIYRTYPYGY
jgi:septal ring factor EnvC (AmiA/AmiB activator)